MRQNNYKSVIKSPCSEDWSKMTPTEKGKFCDMCSKEVVDLRNDTGDVFLHKLSVLSTNNACIRIEEKQDRFVFEKVWQRSSRSQSIHMQRVVMISLIAAFGSGLFSCSDNEVKKRIDQTQQQVQKIQQEESSQDSVYLVQSKPIEAVAPEAVPPLYRMTSSRSKTDTLVCPTVEIRARHRGYGSPGVLTGDIISYGGVPIAVDTKDIIEDFVSYIEYESGDKWRLTIVAPENSRKAEIKLLGKDGKLINKVFTGKIKKGPTSYEVDLASLPAGVYSVDIDSKKFKGVETIRHSD